MFCIDTGKKSVCFSGYRPKKFDFALKDGVPEFEKLKKNLKKVISQLIIDEHYTFYIGLAEGFDIIAGEMVLQCSDELNTPVELKCISPYRDFIDSFNNDWTNRAYDLIEKTSRLKTLYPNYERGCFQKRNKYMVDNSRTLVCFYDGKTGGTKNTINYAKKKNLRIINIFDNTDEKQLSIFYNV